MKMSLVILALFLLGAVVVGLSANYAVSPRGAILSGVAFFVLGEIITQRKLLRRWIVNLFRATHLLVQQEENLKDFVKPFITDVDIYPNPIKKPADVPYITIKLGWDNRSYRKVKIEDIRGVVSVEGHSPPDGLPSSVDDVELKAWQKQDDSLVIAVNLTGDGLNIIQGIRNKGFGKANIHLSLKAQLNGERVIFEPILYKASYVS